jgi:hypothetical protein
VIPATATASSTSVPAPTAANIIPTLPLATLVTPKGSNEGNGDSNQDDRGWLEKAIEGVVDGLLGLP